MFCCFTNIQSTDNFGVFPQLKTAFFYLHQLHAQPLTSRCCWFLTSSIKWQPCQLTFLSLLGQQKCQICKLADIRSRLQTFSSDWPTLKTENTDFSTLELFLDSKRNRKQTVHPSHTQCKHSLERKGWTACLRLSFRLYQNKLDNNIFWIEMSYFRIQNADSFYKLKFQLRILTKPVILSGNSTKESSKDR